MLPYLPASAQSYNDEPGLVAGTYRDFQYAIIRTPLLHLCGYVKISETHQAYQIPYSDLDVSVHGGLTYGRMAEAPFSGYWIGFDCAHAEDFSPSLGTGGIYRDLSYVRLECFRLIDQLHQYKLNVKTQLRQELLATLERFKNEKDYQSWKEAVRSLWL